jgi:hypothetical protein
MIFLRRRGGLAASILAMSMKDAMAALAVANAAVALIIYLRRQQMK